MTEETYPHQRKHTHQITTTSNSFSSLLPSSYNNDYSCPRTLDNIASGLTARVVYSKLVNYVACRPRQLSETRPADEVTSCTYTLLAYC